MMACTIQWRRAAIVFGLFCVVNAYNIDLYGVPLSYKGPAGSFLGFSLAAYTIPGNSSWLLVGAPRANSSAQPTLVSPGVIYKCPLGSLSHLACSQIALDTTGNSDNSKWADVKDGQFLGVSLDARSGATSRMIACGHLWRNNFQIVHKRTDIMPPNGICYIHEGHLQEGNTITIRFSKYGPLFDLSGMAVHVAKDGKIFISRPGYSQPSTEASGGIVVYTPNFRPAGSPYPIRNIPYSAQENSSYLGYAITTGNILSDTKDSYNLVAGAPNYNLEGQIQIQPSELWKNETLSNPESNVTIVAEDTKVYASNENQSIHFKSGFGSALLAVDVNGDGWDDLFVGAPFQQTRVGDEGLVHVYYGIQGDLIEGPKLKSDQQFSRFGTTLSSAGDLDGDGYNDIVVGAPYENDNRGAVYVFNGSPNGVSINYTQRISANELPGQPRGLGYGMAGAFDIDGNGYDDLGVGAYDSNHVFVVRSRPVNTIMTTITLQDTCVKPEQHVCVLSSGNSVPCFRVSFKLAWNSSKPEALARTHAINWDTIMDDYEDLTHRARLINHGNATGEGRGREVLELQEETKQNIIIQVPKNTVDKIRPIRLTTRYSLDNDSEELRRDNPYGLAPIINQTQSGSMVTEMHFCKKCRDLICRTDLAVEMMANATTYVIGQQHPVLFHIEILNGEDGAYNSRLDFLFTQGITVSQYRSQSCVKGSNDKETDFEVFSCDTGNPMLPNSSQTISFVVCCSEKLAPNDLRFTAVVSTRSTETEEELKNNNVTVIIPAINEASLLAKGFSNPDMLVAIATTAEGVSGKGLQRAKHVIDVRNEGPGLAPNFTVLIRLPIVDLYSDIVFNISGLQVSKGFRGVKLGSCRFVENGNGKHQTEPVQSQNLNKQPRNHNLANSNDYAECEIHNLAVKETVTITYNVDVEIPSDETVFHGLGFKSETGFTFVSDIKLPRYIGRGDCGLCQNIQIKTSILPPSADQSVPWWVIIVSGVAGIILFIILIIVLMKMGFFRRNRHEGIAAVRESKIQEESCIKHGDEVEHDHEKELEQTNPQTPQEEKAVMEEYVSAVMKKKES